eukprot:210634-Prymnesium_polylepis.2
MSVSPRAGVGARLAQGAAVDHRSAQARSQRSTHGRTGTYCPLAHALPSCSQRAAKAADRPPGGVWPPRATRYPDPMPASSGVAPVGAASVGMAGARARLAQGGRGAGPTARPVARLPAAVPGQVRAGGGAQGARAQARRGRDGAHPYPLRARRHRGQGALALQGGAVVGPSRVARRERCWRSGLPADGWLASSAAGIRLQARPAEAPPREVA